MKIAISSSGKDLDSRVDSRFGRCAYFLLVDIDDMSFEDFDNESLSLGGGAGIQAAQFVASKGAKALITGNCGPNAVQTLSASGVELFAGYSGTVRDAVESYKNNKLSSTDKANVPDHHGMQNSDSNSQGQFFGGGSGRSTGRGMGGGRGMGRNTGISGQGKPALTDSSDLSKDQELNLLKDQAADLGIQMQEVQAKIKRLEKDF